MILLSSVHTAITRTPGTSAGRWLLWRHSTSLCYLLWSHPFSCLLLKLQSRPRVADNSRVCLPSLLSSFRTVGGRPQTLSPLPINGSRVLMTLGPSWSRSDWNEPTGATGKAYMASSVIFGLGSSWAKVMQTAHDLRPVTDHYSQAGLSALKSELFIHHLLWQLFLVKWRTRCHRILPQSEFDSTHALNVCMSIRNSLKPLRRNKNITFLLRCLPRCLKLERHFLFHTGVASHLPQGKSKHTRQTTAWMICSKFTPYLSPQ